MADDHHESRVWIARPRDAVFAFFADPGNLAHITPGWLGLEMVGDAPAMAAGTVIDARIRWLGVPLRWRTFIREWDPPVRFVDVQIRGPYARWEHRHLFLEDSGGTWVEDLVTYRLPFGPVGRLAHAVVVRRQLDAIWRYRERRIGELVGPVRRSPPAG
ncbi:MAG: SRPBCC family protein [Candidatus Rokubacteria bacterium]|nr:SRPBCC family protein [Candidatus Rokubacteria bacterium]